MAGQGRPGRLRLLRCRRAGQADRRRDRLLRAVVRHRAAASRPSRSNTGAAAPVEATAENASKAIAAAKIVGTGKDLALELDYTTKAEGAYPIVLVTYEIVCDKGNKADTLAAAKSFLNYTASEEGQKLLAEPATPRSRPRSPPRSARPIAGLT